MPVIADPPGWVTRSQKQARMREARRACFEELRRLVGPWNTTRIQELKVLDNGACALHAIFSESFGERVLPRGFAVLARVTARNGDEAQGHGPYGMLHLQA